jgi:putative transposase
LIEAEKATYDITFMCALLGVARSTYYAWTTRGQSATAARRRMLAAQIAAEFTASRATSGCRRIAAALNHKGIACSVGLVADLMRELGLAAVQPRAYKRTTLPQGRTPHRSRTCWAGTSPPPRRVSAWSGTSPTCAQGRDGCTWPP